MLKLRYYQQQAYDAFFEYTRNNWGKNPIIVIPTGGGKSLLQAYIIETIIQYPQTRILLLTHQQELISQNSDELLHNFNDRLIDYGIYSAGLKRRDTSNRIIFAGIQSVYKKAWHLGFFDVIIVDECHLIPHKNEGMYRTFLTENKKINKNIIIGGMSATPFRMKDGLLTDGEGALFDDICHETTVKELIDPNDPRNLENKQYLCNLISKNGINKADLSKVHIRGGEYIPKEMESAFQSDGLVEKAIEEIVKYTENRKKVLIFSAGISHCEEILQVMRGKGLDARCIHSKQSNEKNQKNIDDFKNKKYKYLINVKKLTTGFNDKAIDCIVLLFATKSPGLYYQIVGRGLRLHPDKTDCLILDFGRNIENHGPIDKIEIRKNEKGEKEVGTMPQKECPECQSLLFLAVMECPDCGYIFPSKDKHEEEASEAEILSTWKPPEEIEVLNITYNRHTKIGKPDSMRVDYYHNFYECYSAWICIEHEGYARRKAQQWLRNVTDEEIETVDEALEECKNFREPVKILVDKNSKFPEIKGYIFEEEIQHLTKNEKQIAELLF